MDAKGEPVSGSIGQVADRRRRQDGPTWTSFGLTETDADGAKVRRPARGMEERLPGGELLFVGADVGEAQGYVLKIVNALWGAAALVIVLGLAGGVLVSPRRHRATWRALNRRHQRRADGRPRRAGRGCAAPATSSTSWPPASTTCWSGWSARSPACATPATPSPTTCARR